MNYNEIIFVPGIDDFDITLVFRFLNLVVFVQFYIFP